MTHLQQQQQQDLQREPQQRNNHSQHGIMDLRNLCQRLDVESLKGKLASLPQLRLPKSLPKMRAARRIFCSSRGNNASGSNKAATTAGETAVETEQVPAALFINRTPQRISTISSLMHEQATLGANRGQMAPSSSNHLAAGTYCSAGSLDDDYYAPYGNTRVSRPISPIKIPPPPTAEAAATRNGGNSLTQRLQRGYKNLSELQLKHLFAKETIVRRDGIEVDRYVEQYEAERRVEKLAQERRDREIADNYDIHIRTLPLTRQNTLKDLQQEQLAETARHESDDESGMEEAMSAPVPPTQRKKSGIAATRFAKVRQPPLEMPVQEQQQHQQEQQQEQGQPPIRRAMRQNLKRLRKSIKRVHQHQPKQAVDKQASKDRDDVNDDEEEDGDLPKPSQSGVAGGTMRARLRRFTSSEQLQQRWRKSFKSSSETQVAQGAQGAAVGAAAGATFGMGMMHKLNEKMQQLKFFRQRGSGDSSKDKPPAATQLGGNKLNTVGQEPADIDDDEELAATYHHSDDSDDSNGSDDSGQDVCADEAFGQLDAGEQVKRERERDRPTIGMLAQLQAHSTTAWSSESLEEEDAALGGQQQLAAAGDYPRVLIHQQHTDAYESTLIIAVATTLTPPPTRDNRHQWVSNEQIIAGFKEQQQLTAQACNSSRVWPGPALYKPKSIDIFESEGGPAGAFADFDEALRNAPVLRISAGSSEEDADDSSSRVTRIRRQTPQIGNSCESLMEQQPLEEDDDNDNNGNNEDMDMDMEMDVDVTVDDEQLELAERPPSVSPPPPPLPQRRPPPSMMAPIYDAVPPPLPISKPPLTIVAAATAATAAPAPAPVPVASPAAAKLPQRSVSMTHPSKPLVKTSSLRLTYREQMHPGDVGKVNKLISRFEGRPRLCGRRLHSEELTICSDEDEPADDLFEQMQVESVSQLTPTNVKCKPIPDIVTTPTPTPTTSNNNSCHNLSRDLSREQLELSLDRQNSNCSRSQYGSPLPFPNSQSQRRSSTPTMPTTSISSRSARSLAPQTHSHSQSQLARSNRRSMTRDDDNFYSFDSDEATIP
ncbi:actin cytoskeleton-regulatory complex protein pan1 isoform X2 [Drosophila grimshawi]|uniref:actin cytoskeleton-regulatory complex protein pan1 isoform X2 n=1 Tax=Drosophila grimshawi TaxID=7222 RepID=UPI000C870115|nr:actin cytoskeleton-regulatory complex protein pan1 isoform X2 [Drosophila grimshawi]